MNVLVLDIREGAPPSPVRAITNACELVMPLSLEVTAPEIKLAGLFQRAGRQAQSVRNPFVAPRQRPPKSLGVRR